MVEKNILVTGGNGLVGSCFFDYDQKYHLWGRLNCDLRDKNRLKQKKIGKWYNGIIHTAAKVGGVGSNMKYKGEFFYDNIMMNTNIIETAREEGIENLVVFLSTCIFPDDVEYPLSEDKIHLGPPHNSNDAYAYAKRMADIQIRAYREQYGLNYKCVIPTNIYGINDNFNIDNGHVIPSLIHKCYLAKINNEPLIVWGTGKPLREFIYNKDVAKLTTWVLENYNESEPIILSPSEEISIKELVNMIVDIMDFKGDVIWDDTKPDGQYRKPTDNSKLRKYLPDFEFTPLYDGLSETIEWFINNYEKVRK
jgi:GDP-L-fucose synthase